MSAAKKQGKLARCQALLDGERARNALLVSEIAELKEALRSYGHYDKRRVAERQWQPLGNSE